MKIRRCIYLLVLLFGFLACNTNSQKNKEANENSQTSNEYSKVIADNNIAKDLSDAKHCFLKLFENEPIMINGKVVQRMIDSTQIVLNINNNNVEGVFNYLPAEQDSRRGKFSGEIDLNKKIKAIYVFDAEGATYKEGLIIQLEEDNALIKFADLDFNSTSKELEVSDNDREFDKLPRIACK